MFKDSKYTFMYFGIINKARARINQPAYTEKHHIIPKSLGGSNDQENLVRLSYREHFLCHWLLTRMVDGKDRRRMNMAFWRMTTATKGQKRELSSRHYEIAKKHRINAHIGSKRSDETKRRISEGKTGKSPNYSDEERKRRAELVAKRNVDPEFIKLKSARLAKKYILTDPDGNKIEVTNLAVYCRENNLHAGNLNSVANGRLKQTKGWTCTYA